MEELMDLKKAAEYLGIQPNGVYWLRRMKRIAFHKVNGKLRFKPEDLDQYLERVRFEAS